MRKFFFFLSGLILLTAADLVNKEIRSSTHLDTSSCVRKYDFSDPEVKILTMVPVGKYLVGNNREGDIIAIEIRDQDTLWTPMIHAPSYVADPLRAIQFDTVSENGIAQVSVGSGFWDTNDVYHFEAVDSARFQFNEFRLEQFLHPEKAVSLGFKGDEILIDARNLNADPRNPLRFFIHDEGGELVDAAPLNTWEIKRYDKTYLPKGSLTLECINYKGCVVWKGVIEN